MSRRKKYDNPKRRKMMIQLQDLHDSSDDLSSEDSLVEFGNAKLSPVSSPVGKLRLDQHNFKVQRD